MTALAGPLIICVAFILYWLNRPRRLYFKRRAGKQTIYNLYRITRNINHMLSNRLKIEIKGSIENLKRGAVLYSWHFGLWELMPRALSTAGYETGLIANRYGTAKSTDSLAWLDCLLHRWRSRNGIHVFYREDTKKIIDFLRAGGIFGILVDGNTPYAKFEKAKKLARICNVPLIPFAVYRNHTACILEIGCDLEGLMKHRPYDYMWLYKSRS